jgi:hypothetical protein
MKSGIRQGDPLSPALFSALVGHVLRPLIERWKEKGWGVQLDETQTGERITILAYADDITVFASSREEASRMINEMAIALEGINLKLLPEKCSALWSEAPAGTEAEKINLGAKSIPIVGALVVLGQEISFKKDSMHSFQHRLRQAWKTAHANATLLRSTTTSHGDRIRLLQALVKPSLLYGVETWKLTPALLSKIIATERAFSRWCLRLNGRADTTGDDERDTANWIQWQTDSARRIAKTSHKQKIERWHVTALRLHWNWAGKAVRNKNTPNYRAATQHVRPSGRGRPQAHWEQLLRQFSAKEMTGGPDFWVQLAENKTRWLSFTHFFVEFVETKVLRADTRSTLARDAMSIRQSTD